MTKNVLLLCPHNAAKSVVAAALLTRASIEHELGLTIGTGGTDPDQAVLPFVRDYLRDNGMPAGDTPRTVTEADLTRADIVINMGCSPADLPTDRAVVDWQIPNFSDDEQQALSALDHHVADLVDDLMNG